MHSICGYIGQTALIAFNNTRSQSVTRTREKDAVPDAVLDAVLDTVLDAVPDAVPDAGLDAGRTQEKNVSKAQI